MFWVQYIYRVVQKCYGVTVRGVVQTRQHGVWRSQSCPRTWCEQFTVPLLVTVVWIVFNIILDGRHAVNVVWHASKKNNIAWHAFLCRIMTSLLCTVCHSFTFCTPWNNDKMCFRHSCLLLRRENKPRALQFTGSHSDQNPRCAPKNTYLVYPCFYAPY